MTLTDKQRVAFGDRIAIPNSKKAGAFEDDPWRPSSLYNLTKWAVRRHYLPYLGSRAEGGTTSTN